MPNEPNAPDLHELLSRVALADRAAFDTLYAAASPKLFAVLIRILRDRSMAEDALQEVFVKVWQKADGFRSGSQAPMAWLYAIARNHAIDTIRAQKRLHDDLDDHQELSSPEPDPEQAAVAASERERIDNCLEELEPQKAEAVVSAYMEGYSYQELADRYSVPLNTMRTWLRRSLISLRKCLDDG
ncbi:sigma-70 family RNA polymerase sigma factor [Salaquimonas pukyongi]|uniref:sigma-70 family RNA polymerase sigma factor n=1 Tax=Salaquimonas pukyongi TaxID=2712698 RepID=UPI00096B8A65|nr:sigma-70 family RNA polymerase sigma factor [Salaquimonas pukyongi]